MLQRLLQVLLDGWLWQPIGKVPMEQETTAGHEWQVRGSAARVMRQLGSMQEQVSRECTQDL